MNDQMRTMSRIADWWVEAAREPNLDYYVPFDMQDKVLEGRRSFIVGRKGTGKTALCTFIEGNGAAKRLPVDLYHFMQIEMDETKNINVRHDMVEAWTYVIYLAACEVASARGMPISYDNRKELQAKFAPDPHILRGDKAGLSNFRTSFKFWGAEAALAGERAAPIPFPDFIRQATRFLESVLLEDAIRGPIYVLFDELDDQLNASYLTWRQRRKIVGPLFKAVANIKGGALRNKLFPIVSVREDLFFDLEENDASKWLDLTYQLAWSDGRIMSMLRHRIELASEIPAPDFDTAWRQIIAGGKLKNGSGRYPTFDHIRSVSQNRPRDYVAFLRVCAEQAYNDKKPQLTQSYMEAQTRNYGNWAYLELLQEISLILPHAKECLGVLRDIGKPILHRVAFERAYLHELGNRPDCEPPEKAIEILWRYGIIGTVHANLVRVFSYEGGGEMARTELIAVHKSLLTKLTIF